MIFNLSRFRLMTMTLVPISLIYVVVLGIGLITNTKRSIAITDPELESRLPRDEGLRFDADGVDGAPMGPKSSSRPVRTWRRN